MGDLRDGGIMSVVWRPAEGKWRVRIAVDNGLVVESKAAYDTARLCGHPGVGPWSGYAF